MILLRNLLTASDPALSRTHNPMAPHLCELQGDGSAYAPTATCERNMECCCAIWRAAA
jgi:hypothetical protein